MGGGKNSDTIFMSELCFCISCRVSFAREQQDEGETNGNELLVELEGKDEKKERETNMWFSKVWIAHLDEYRSLKPVDFNALTSAQDIFAELDLDDDKDAMSELIQTQLLQSGKGKKRKAEAEPAAQEEEVATPSQEVEKAGDEDDSDSDDDSSDDERWRLYIFVYISTAQAQFHSLKKLMCFSTGKLRKWNTPQPPSAWKDWLMTTTFKLFLLKKQVSSESYSTFDIIRIVFRSQAPYFIR